MKENLFRTIKKYKALLLLTASVVLFALIITLSLAFGGAKTIPSENVNTEPLKFVMPVANATISKSYNNEELQYNKTLNCWEIHKGLDLLATSGDKVFACFEGKVTQIYSNYLEGTTIEITHSDGLVSIYQGLNSETKVSVGDNVSTNQEIGSVASLIGSENEDGSHIHFELLQDGEKIDPINYIEIGLKD